MIVCLGFFLVDSVSFVCFFLKRMFFFLCKWLVLFFLIKKYNKRCCKWFWKKGSIGFYLIFGVVVWGFFVWGVVFVDEVLLFFDVVLVYLFEKLLILFDISDEVVVLIVCEIFVNDYVEYFEVFGVGCYGICGDNLVVNV